MRHFRSILYALVLAPAVWVLVGTGLTRDLTTRGRADFAAESATGFLLLLLAASAYGILLFAPISPAGPSLAGLVFLGLAVWALAAPSAYAGVWSPAVTKDGFDLSRPGYGLAALLAVPLIGTALSARRWARYEPPVLPIIGQLGRARGAAPAPGTPAAALETAVMDISGTSADAEPTTVLRLPAEDTTVLPTGPDDELTTVLGKAETADQADSVEGAEAAAVPAPEEPAAEEPEPAGSESQPAGSESQPAESESESGEPVVDEPEPDEPAAEATTRSLTAPDPDRTRVIPLPRPADDDDDDDDEETHDLGERVADQETQAVRRPSDDQTQDLRHAMAGQQTDARLYPRTGDVGGDRTQVIRMPGPRGDQESTQVIRAGLVEPPGERTQVIRAGLVEPPGERTQVVKFPVPDAVAPNEPRAMTVTNMERAADEIADDTTRPIPAQRRPTADES